MEKLNLDKLERRANAKWEREIRKRNKEINDKNQKATAEKNEYINNLLKKVSEKNKEENKKKFKEEMKEEINKTKNKVFEKYEDKEKENKINTVYKRMLKNMED